MPVILVIDDDVNVRAMVVMALEDAGHAVIEAADGVAGLEAHATHKPAIVVSDVNMPRLDGFSLCRRLRDDGHRTPILLLTARDSEIDEALGLDLGADDYLAKPFATRVLIARVAALLRRIAPASFSHDDLLTAGALVLDPARIEIRFQGTLVESTVTEFRLLEALARRPGIVQDRDALLQQARQDDSVVAPRLVDTYIRRLRRKMEAIDARFHHIETVIGAGYRWRE